MLIGISLCLQEKRLSPGSSIANGIALISEDRRDKVIIGNLHYGNWISLREPL